MSNNLFKYQNWFNTKNINLPEPACSDNVDLNSYGIILWNESDLQKIYKKSGKLAKNNEFQFHYWILNYRHQAKDGSILDIAIPTCMFNYEQEVSPAHIDFELKDVGAISNKVIPLNNIKINEILNSTFQQDIEKLFNLKFEPIAVNISSCHRHPGSAEHQSFSGTDLSTNKKDIGIVFPFESAKENKPNFAAIVGIDQNNLMKIAHCEYRTANGTINKDLKYIKHKCTSIITRDNKKVSDINKIFGDESFVKHYAKYNNTREHEIINQLAMIFKNIKFEASTDAIIEDNIKLRKSFQTTNNNKMLNLFSNSPEVSKEEYKKAKHDLEKYKNFKILTDDELNNYSTLELDVVYKKIYELYYDKKYDEPEEYFSFGDEEYRTDVMFEIKLIQDDVLYEIADAKDIIKEFELEQKENKKNKQQSKKKQTTIKKKETYLPLKEMHEYFIKKGYKEHYIKSFTYMQLHNMIQKEIK